MLGHAQDVTELREAQEQLRRLSLTDELTGLHNRRGFFTLAEQLLQKVAASGAATELSVVYVDVDGLKRVNDAYGHDAGSQYRCRGGCADQYVPRRGHRRPDRRRRVRRPGGGAAGHGGCHYRAHAASPGRVQRAQRHGRTRWR